MTFVKGNKINLGKPRSEETKRKISEYRKGKVGYWKGKKMSDEHKRRMSETSKRIGNRPPINRREKCNFWKGGVTLLYDLVRTSFQYRQWRSDIFTRDNFTCQQCNKKGGNIEAHHLRPISTIIEENGIKTLESAIMCEELWNINNGITLCEKCHELTESYGRKRKVR